MMRSTQYVAMGMQFEMEGPAFHNGAACGDCDRVVDDHGLR